MRHFLDNQQYNTAGILRYEKVFGAGFVSTGGAATTAAFVDALALRPGDAVLDVGCGIGGGAFYMAARHGARVHGVDLSVNMVLLAMARAADARADAVSFEIADVATVPLPAAAYDVVYSRDTILHVADKKALLERLCAALKPGGRLLVTDYCSSGDPPSPEFGAYIAQRGYHLLSVPDYGAALCAAGFADVEADDRTWQFKAALDAELARARGQGRVCGRIFRGRLRRGRRRVGGQAAQGGRGRAAVGVVHGAPAGGGGPRWRCYRRRQWRQRTLTRGVEEGRRCASGFLAARSRGATRVERGAPGRACVSDYGQGSIHKGGQRGRARNPPRLSTPTAAGRGNPPLPPPSIVNANRVPRIITPPAAR